MNQHTYTHPGSISTASLTCWSRALLTAAMAATALSFRLTCSFCSATDRKQEVGVRAVVGNNVVSSSHILAVIGEDMGYQMVGGRRPALSYSLVEVTSSPFWAGDFSLC
jgi:hypothetical protein